jgi:CRISPR-associated protein Cas2
MAWILAYDIACPRRWRRVYRLARERGVRLQWSVFLITEAQFDPRRFLAEAARIIDPRADDVRLYRVAGSIVGNLDHKALCEPIEGVQWRGPSPRPGFAKRRLTAPHCDGHD